MTGAYDEQGNLWGEAGRGTVGKGFIAIIADAWRLDLSVRGVMILVQAGFSLEQAAHVLVRVSLDEVLCEIGAFPDRPLVRKCAR